MMAHFLPSMPNEAHLHEINNSLLAENTPREQNEQQLYTASQQSEMDKKHVQTKIHDLNNDIGLQFNILLVFPFLNSGLTMANFSL
jgi:hypothetical protein